jgi:hypothetical protein
MRRIHPFLLYFSVEETFNLTNTKREKQFEFCARFLARATHRQASNPPILIFPSAHWELGVVGKKARRQCTIVALDYE